MGGIGSGRRSGGYQETLDDLEFLDMRALTRKHRVTPERRFVVSLGPRNASTKSYWIQVVSEDWLYAFNAREGPIVVRESDKTWIRLSRSPCNFGGARLWFHCPVCERRVAKLYLRHRDFRCLACTELCYRSQLEDRGSRAIRKARKFRRRLAASSNLTIPVATWHKPKNMHWRTFRRLLSESQAADQRCCSVFSEQLHDMRGILSLPQDLPPRLQKRNRDT